MIEKIPFLNRINICINYSWALIERLAEKGFSKIILFFLAMIEAVFFPLPPDILLISLGISNRSKIWYFFVYCTLGSVVGATISYGIGALLWGTAIEPSAIASFFFKNIPGFSKQNYNYIGSLLHEYNFWVIFVVGFTPLPFKVITIVAGAFHLDFLFFILATLVGRGGRFFIISLALRLWGEQARKIIRKNFNWVSLIFISILFFVLFILKMLF